VTSRRRKRRYWVSAESVRRERDSLLAEIGRHSHPPTPGKPGSVEVPLDHPDAVILGRLTKQLSVELGVSRRTIQRRLAELRLRDALKREIQARRPPEPPQERGAQESSGPVPWWLG